MEIGRFGLLVADVGTGGSDSKGGVIPGIRSATTLFIARTFCMI
jgi:hypothetical protein